MVERENVECSPTKFLKLSIIMISMALFFFDQPLHILDTYAQQGGSATGGDATGGSAQGGSAQGGCRWRCYGGDATGGDATGGSAQGGGGGNLTSNTSLATDNSSLVKSPFG